MAVPFHIVRWRDVLYQVAVCTPAAAVEQINAGYPGGVIDLLVSLEAPIVPYSIAARLQLARMVLAACGERLPVGVTLPTRLDEQLATMIAHVKALLASDPPSAERRAAALASNPAIRPAEVPPPPPVDPPAPPQ